jgi:hypothetical protein
MHEPPWQISPGAQGSSHAPQCWALEDRSVQPVEQQFSGGVHVVAMLQAHVPTKHVLP